MSIKASISYKLSQKGQRASLLQSGDGRPDQVQSGDIEPADLDAFVVDEDGHPHCEAILAPENCTTGKYSLAKRATRSWWGGQFSVQWDVVPIWEDLLTFVRFIEGIQQAAGAEMYADHLADEETANQVGLAFLAEPNARAEKVSEDSVTIGGHDFWGSSIVEEAKRRWAHDQEELKKANRATLAEWTALHGTENQRQRLAAGLLPWAEVFEAAEEHLYAPLAGFPLYKRFEVQEVCECVAAGAEKACKVKFQSLDAVELTAEEWDQYSKIQAAAPQANFQLREHRAECAIAFDPQMRRGVIVKLSLGKLTFKREFALSERL